MNTQKSIFLLFAAVLLSLTSLTRNNCFISYYQDETTLFHERGMPTDEKEYREIILGSHFDNFNMNTSFKERWQRYCDDHILAFRNFIDKYPESAFVPEAKLRIAEYYQLSFRKHKARKWLDDIIKNHTNDKHYSLRKKHEVEEWTAAWALYYRGKWFNKKADLKKIIINYPESRIFGKNEKNGKTRIFIKKILPPSQK